MAGFDFLSNWYKLVGNSDLNPCKLELFILYMLQTLFEKVMVLLTDEIIFIDASVTSVDGCLLQQ